MGTMSRGQPRSVPDPAGELYDREMAKVRAQREAEDRGIPLVDFAKGALRDFQDGPRIARPNVAQTFIPVVGPAWEAAADLQDGDYAGAALNAGSALVDLTGGGAMVVKGGRVLSKGVKLLNEGSRTADSSRKILRARGIARPGEEIHHTRPLNGLGRNVPDSRNDYMFLKVLPKEQHRRLTGSWKGKPKYGPFGQVWHGTNAWQKAIPSAVGGHVASATERATDR